MMWNYGSGLGWGFGMGLGWIVPLIFLAFLVWLGFQAVRALTGGRTGGSERESSALAILKERYARGELDRETFERMRIELK
jgi:putative membrane protein